MIIVWFLILSMIYFQTMTKSSSDAYDVVRTCRMAGYGMIILGPSLHLWFNFVSKVFPKQDIISIFKKIFMGQIIYGPIMTAVFFSVNAALQGITTTLLSCFSISVLIDMMKSALIDCLSKRALLKKRESKKKLMSESIEFFR